MLIDLLKFVALFYYWTWFIWPFVFVFTLIYSISSLVKDEKTSMMPAFIASLSLLIILAGITAPNFNF